MDTGRIHLLVDCRLLQGESSSDTLRALLAAISGVLSVNVYTGGTQVAVDVEERPGLVEHILTTLQANGYYADASRIPGLADDPSYARYYHADPDSVDGRWLD